MVDQRISRLYNCFGIVNCGLLRGRQLPNCATVRPTCPDSVIGEFIASNPVTRSSYIQGHIHKRERNSYCLILLLRSLMSYIYSYFDFYTLGFRTTSYNCLVFQSKTIKKQCLSSASM